jgi:formate hydrogenlyase subunit 3/multisubunit Na+/H+ antiporter MnhD subunit
MNPALLKVLLALAPTLLLLLLTGALYVRTKAAAALVQALGAAFLLVVVFAHLCEALNLLPFMGWGAQGSIGHYIDLASAILGVALLTVGALIHALSKRKAHAA